MKDIAHVAFVSHKAFPKLQIKEKAPKPQAKPAALGLIFT